MNPHLLLRLSFGLTIKHSHSENIPALVYNAIRKNLRSSISPGAYTVLYSLYILFITKIRNSLVHFLSLSIQAGKPYEKKVIDTMWAHVNLALFLFIATLVGVALLICVLCFVGVMALRRHR